MSTFQVQLNLKTFAVYQLAKAVFCFLNEAEMIHYITSREYI